MSRSTVAKSRADRSGKGASLTAPVARPAHEIVPGKFNDQEWNLMLEHDDGCELVTDIVDEICNSTLDIIFQNYIQKQLVPYTVLQAKDAILQIIEWQFLSRDEGEQDVEGDPGWLEDEEPAPSMTDCWAQGSVPRQVVSVDTPRIEEEDEEYGRPTTVPEEEAVESHTEQLEPEVPAEDEVINAEEKATEETDSIPTEEETSQKKEEKPCDKKETLHGKKKKKFKYKRYVGRIGSGGLSKMTESLEDTEMRMRLGEPSPRSVQSPDSDILQMPASLQSMIKLQAGRPPGNRDVCFDEFGNVTGIEKINPARLPSHRVKTGFQVIDPHVEAAKARLEAMRTGKYVGDPKKNLAQTATPRSTRTTVDEKTSSRTCTTMNTQQHYGRAQAGVTPLPPPLLESMDVSPGVVIREGDRVKEGPKHHPKRRNMMKTAGQQELRPIAVKATLPTLTVAELLEHHTPVIRPLVDTVPIPPIQSQSSIASH